MNPHPKFGLDVEANDSIHAPREHKKAYFSHNQAFWGRAGHVLKQVQKWHDRVGKRE